MLIILCQGNSFRIQMKLINLNMVLHVQVRANKVEQKILVDLTMIPVDAKIGLYLDIVFLVIVVFIYMIVVIIKLGGNFKKILRKVREKDGKKLSILP